MKIERLGVIGAGHLAGFVAKGLRKAEWNGTLIIPERRGAADFSALHGADIVADAQTVVDDSDAVLVSVRPQQADDVLSGLNWPEGRILLSAMAGVKIARLQALAPDARIFRAMPISAAVVGASPTPLFPQCKAAENLLTLLGPVIAMPAEAALEAASTNAAAYGWFFRLIDRLVAANREAGLDDASAKMMAISTLIGAGQVALNDDRQGEEILETLATPGGITAQGLAVLDAANAFDPWEDAFRSVAERLAEH